MSAMYGVPQASPNWESSLSFLKLCDTSELNAILEDEDKVNEHVKNSDQIKQLESDKEMMLASNKSLAQYNLDKEQPLRNAKAQLAETYATVMSLMEEFKAKKAELDGLSPAGSLETTVALLQTAAAEAEEESEAIADQFLQGNLEVETFLESFQLKRQLSHLRRVKSEKMADLVTEQRKNQRSQQILNAYENNTGTPPVPSRRPPSFPQQGGVRPPYAGYPAYPMPQQNAGMPYPPYPGVPNMPMPAMGGYRPWSQQ